jgi:hypothetical protein
MFNGTIIILIIMFARFKLIVFVRQTYYTDSNKCTAVKLSRTTRYCKLQSSFSKTINFPLFLHIKKFIFENLIVTCNTTLRRLDTTFTYN